MGRSGGGWGLEATPKKNSPRGAPARRAARPTASALERDDHTGFHPDERLGGSTGISLGGTYVKNDQDSVADERQLTTTSASARTTAT